MILPKLISFDLDMTLARSKQPIEGTMAALLTKLLARTKVAIESGGTFEQFRKQAVNQLPQDATLDNLYLLPTSGATLYEHRDGAWSQVYEERLTEDEIEEITAQLTKGAEASGLVDFSHPGYGEYIENRNTQVTLSALGQEAPPEVKLTWDPSRTKREALRAAIAPLLPNFSVDIGGATSIDVTKRGINKAFGIRRLCSRLHIPIEEMLYVGDELEEGGNDAVVKETGIRTHSVEGPSDTAQFISELLAGN